MKRNDVPPFTFGSSNDSLAPPSCVTFATWTTQNILGRWTVGGSNATLTSHTAAEEEAVRGRIGTKPYSNLYFWLLFFLFWVSTHPWRNCTSVCAKPRCPKTICDYVIKIVTHLSSGPLTTVSYFLAMFSHPVIRTYSCLAGAHTSCWTFFKTQLCA